MRNETDKNLPLRPSCLLDRAEPRGSDFNRASGAGFGESPDSNTERPTLDDFGDGEFNLSELPPPNTKRWVIRRKAQVVTGVRLGAISLEEACRRYKLSIEEFLSWQRLIESHGMAGLRTTRLQDYRDGVKQD